MQRRYPHSPLFAIGHSMGGMIVLRACLNHSTLFKGVILQASVTVTERSTNHVMWNSLLSVYYYMTS